LQRVLALQLLRSLGLPLLEVFHDC
jgi:hypothetical protein